MPPTSQQRCGTAHQEGVSGWTYTLQRARETCGPLASADCLPGPLRPSSPAPTAAIAAPASQVAEALSGPSGEEGLWRQGRGGVGGVGGWGGWAASDLQLRASSPARQPSPAS